MRKHYTGSQHEELVRLVTTRRATVAEAAARLGVTMATAYRWVRHAANGEVSTRQALTRTASTATFVRLVPAEPRNGELRLHVGGVAIEVRTGFDAELLRAVVIALRGGAA